jgi:hypothetical protein
MIHRPARERESVDVSAIRLRGEPEASDSPAFVTAAEREIYREYDRQRRLRLARAIAGFLCILVTTLSALELLTYIFNGLFHADPLLALLYTGADLTVAAIQACGYLAARRERVGLATGLVIGVIVAATFFCISENFLERALGANSLLGFFSLLIGIVAVGLLGNLWQIVSITVFINLYTLLAAYIIIPDATGQWPAAPWHGFPFAMILIFV